MSVNIDNPESENASLHEVWSVRDFVRRHRLTLEEERRLTELFGSFATKQELLMNSRRSTQIR